MDTDGRCAAPQRPAPAPSPCPLHVRSGPRLDVLACRSARGGGGRSSGDAARGVGGGEACGSTAGGRESGEGVRGAGEWLRMSGRRGNGYSCLGAGGQSMAEHGCWAAAPFVLSPGRFCRIHRESNQPALSDQRFLGGLSSFRIEAQMHNEIRWRSTCSPD